MSSMVNKQNLDAKSKNIQSSEFERRSEIDSGADLLRRENDERFGEIGIVQLKASQQILMMKEKVSNSEKEAAAEVVQAKERLAINHPHIQKMVDYSTKTKSDFCSKFYKLRAFYEYPDSDLKKQIAQRKKNLTGFSSEELTLVAYQCLMGLKHLHSKGVSFGDLRPEFISFSKVGNQHQLLDRLRDPNDSITANRNNLMANKPLYCSPAIYNGLKKKVNPIRHNEAKSDCWSLGLCILEAATLDNVQDIYVADGSINQARLGQHLAAMEAKYGQENKILCELTANLLSIDENNRYEAAGYIDSLPAYDVILEHFNSTRGSTGAQGQWATQGAQGSAGFNASGPSVGGVQNGASNFGASNSAFGLGQGGQAGQGQWATQAGQTSAAGFGASNQSSGAQGQWANQVGQTSAAAAGFGAAGQNASAQGQWAGQGAQVSGAGFGASNPAVVTAANQNYGSQTQIGASPGKPNFIANNPQDTGYYNNAQQNLQFNQSATPSTFNALPNNQQFSQAPAPQQTQQFNQQTPAPQQFNQQAAAPQQNWNQQPQAVQQNWNQQAQFQQPQVSQQQWIDQAQFQQSQPQFLQQAAPQQQFLQQAPQPQLIQQVPQQQFIQQAPQPQLIQQAPQQHLIQQVPQQQFVQQVPQQHIIQQVPQQQFIQAAPQPQLVQQVVAQPQLVQTQPTQLVQASPIITAHSIPASPVIQTRPATILPASPQIVSTTPQVLSRPVNITGTTYTPGTQVIGTRPAGTTIIPSTTTTQSPTVVRVRSFYLSLLLESATLTPLLQLPSLPTQP